MKKLILILTFFTAVANAQITVDIPQLSELVAKEFNKKYPDWNTANISPSLILPEYVYGAIIITSDDNKKVFVNDTDSDIELIFNTENWDIADVFTIYQKNGKIGIVIDAILYQTNGIRSSISFLKTDKEWLVIGDYEKLEETNDDTSEDNSSIVVEWIAKNNSTIQSIENGYRNIVVRSVSFMTVSFDTTVNTKYKVTFLAKGNTGGIQRIMNWENIKEVEPKSVKVTDTYKTFQFIITATDTFVELPFYSSASSSGKAGDFIDVINFKSEKL